MLSIAVAQINLRVGAFDRNLERILDFAKQAQQQGVDLVLYPELTVCGYLPEDLLFRSNFLTQNQQALGKLVEASKNLKPSLLVGTPIKEGFQLFNSLLWIHQGQIKAQYHKQCLPNHSVFDEKRYFSPGKTPCVIDVNGYRVGLLVCEDAWHPQPAQDSVAAGAQLLVVSNASPWYLGKEQHRLAAIQSIAKANQVPTLYAHMTGSQDEVVFDGASFAVNAQGEVTYNAPQFQEVLSICQVQTEPNTKHRIQITGSLYPGVYDQIPDKQSAHSYERLWKALVLSTKDYVSRSHFSNVLIGLSGGIDSALVLAIAVEALGAKAVHAILMSSPYTAAISIEDANLLAQRLEVKTTQIPITSLITPYETSLVEGLNKPLSSLTKENIQSRIRGQLLMGLSNDLGALVLTTGNKSELATGYCTLYGDMCGAFSVIKDLYKTQVFGLARWYNQTFPSHPIPERILTRPPSAELKENQTDQDTLPDYVTLDAILYRLVEQRKSTKDISQEGFNPLIVQKVSQLLAKSEFKRKQGAIGPKVSECAFGKDWRYPLLNDFKL